MATKNAPAAVPSAPTSIYKALVASQKAFAPALKTSNNPHFKSRYAALDAVVDAVIDALNENGIFLTQKTHICDDGVMVETILIHESGESLSGGLLHVPVSKNDAQGFGSALTYARRYSLMAVTGVAPEDDDGNAATSAKPVKQEKPAVTQQEVDKALSALNAAAQRGTAEFTRVAGTIPESVKQSIPDLKKREIWEAAKLMDQQNAPEGEAA